MVAKVDALMDSLPKGQALAYADLPRMTFMTRCITETLRLWPSVPNGECPAQTLALTLCFDRTDSGMMLREELGVGSSKS